MNRRDKTIINMMDIATEATHECERMQRKLTLFETFARNVAKTTMPNLLTFPDDYGLDDIEDAVSNLRAKLERFEGNESAVGRVKGPEPDKDRMRVTAPAEAQEGEE